MATESPLERLRRLEAEEQAASRAAAPASQPGQPAQNNARRSGITGVIIAVFLFLLTKGKLLLGAIKFGPLLTTLTTMAASAWIYANFYGAHLAIGFVLLILVHELGHGVAARLMNLRASAPIFIPFFGAVIMLKDQVRTTWQDAVVGFGGPLAGMLGGVAVLAAALLVKDPWWSGLLTVLAWLTFMINFFNLMPIFGMDGDRISQPFRPWYWLPGCVYILGLIALCVEVSGEVNPFVLFILILGAVKGGRGWWKERSNAPPERLLDRLAQQDKYTEEHSVAPWQRRTAALAYFSLAGALCVLMLYANTMRPALK